MTRPPRWKVGEAFGLLCDLVADGRVVAMTGAGFSSELLGTDGLPLPSWNTLLSSVADILAPTAMRPPALDALAKSASTGRDLIELASMLSALDPK